MLLLAACRYTAPLGAPLEAPLEASVETLGSHERRVRVHLGAPAALTLRCEGDGDVIELASDVATDHVFDLVGLLAGATYACDGGVAFTVEDADPIAFEVSGEFPDQGLLLLNSFVPNGPALTLQRLLLVDSEGRVRWEAASEETTADIALEWLGGGQMLWGGGGRPPRIETLTHETVFDAATFPEVNGWYHHDARRVDDDSILTLLETQDTDGTNTWVGFEIRIIAVPSGALEWTWSSRQGFEDAPVTADPDPYHANSVSLHGDHVLLNLRDLGQAWAIDRETGAVDWRVGAGGDFTLEGDGTWWSGAHAPEFDGERFLIYDNGATRTRVADFVLDVENRTAQATWSWTREGWHDEFWGDVDRLADGTVVVTESRRTFAVDPVDDRVLWEVGSERAAYRSELLDGCEVLPGRCSGDGP